MRVSLFSLCLALVVGCGLVGNSFAAGGEAVEGVWLNQARDAHIQIIRQGDTYAGKIVWLAEPLDPKTQKPKVDSNNPDPGQRNRPIIDLVILRDFVYAGNSTWQKGKIYDPNVGKTYSCTMKLTDPGTLNIRGFIGISLLGRTEVWTRVKPAQAN